MILKLLIASCLSALTIGNALSQFEPEKPIAIRLDGPQKTFAADINNDGLNDLLAISMSHNRVVWYKNLGNGDFGQYHEIPGNILNGRSIHAADLDNDGDFDVMSASGGDDKVAWNENLGNGQFGPQQIISSNVNYAESVFSKDLDNDGNLDILAVSSLNNTVFWYQNLGNGSFGSETAITTSASSGRCVYSDDIDSDGDNDVLVAYSSSIGWCENLGAGTFSTLQTISSNTLTARSIIAADINNDGDLDIVSGSSADNKVAWYENLGFGTFGPQQIITTSANSVWQVGSSDIDNDGDQDVFSSSGADDKLAWYENLGGGVFAPQEVISTAYDNAVSVVLADFDDDGNDDVLCAGHNNDLIQWHQYINGSFSQGNPVSILGSNPSIVEHADLNNDGSIDIIVGNQLNNLFAWYYNDGAGNFPSQMVKNVTQSAMATIFPADVNNDGFVDLIIASINDNTIAWYENLSGTGFGNIQVIDNLSIGAEGVIAHDLDDDGDLDIISSTIYDNSINLFENLGGGLFGPKELIANNAIGGADLTIADMDGDGLLDIVAAISAPSKVVWYKNLGALTFNTEILLANNFSYSASALRMGDIDNDGDHDLIVAFYDDNAIEAYINDGTGIVQTLTITTTFDTPNHLEVEDLNNDGFLDILVSSHQTDQIVYYLGFGTGFSPENSTSSISIVPTGLSIADFDNDGDFDFVCSFFTNVVSIFLNTNFYTTQISGACFVDQNQNEIFDANEVGMNQVQILSSPLSDFSYANVNGHFGMNFSDSIGVYQIAPNNLPSFWTLTTDSASYTVNVDSNFLSLNSLLFGFFPNSIVDSVSADIVGASSKCDNVVRYWIDVKNEGSTTPSGLISVELDNVVSYVSANPIPDSIVGQLVYWSYDSLNYFAHHMITLDVLIPDFTFLGDTITNNVSASITDQLNSVIFNSNNSLDQIITCAYDPNDKLVDPPGIGNENHISSETEYLDYTVRFQNTGNDTANLVVIKDQLDSKLVKSTLSILGSSHNIETFVNQNGEISFYFDSIMLPDSTTNEIESHGYLKYRIHLDQNLPLGTIIYNTAHIFFDYNPAIITNTAFNTLYNCDSLDVQWGQMPDSLCLSTSSFGLPISFPSGGTYSGLGIIGNTFDPSTAGVGLHELLYTFSDGVFCSISDTLNLLVTNCAEIDEFGITNLTLYPNPADNELIVKIEPVYLQEYVVITDAIGKIIHTSLLSSLNNTINISAVKPGIYTVRVKNETNRLVIH